MMVNLNSADIRTAVKPRSTDQWSNERYLMRQRYLRSYRFTKKKETVIQRTKKWLVEKQKEQYLSSDDKHAAAGTRKPKHKRLSAYVRACLIKLLLRLCVANVDTNAEESKLLP
ncbi:Uncharacterized protein TCM_000477 [Theobroma cacao]|uniref:Uncharacterized protein n=1 Tax=Theobroma cacao TaxID=3641 RepID=A0A061DG26_THECC|nr:Uncharacterized protein TCM_000477 [Theobroma cacao]